MSTLPVFPGAAKKAWTAMMARALVGLSALPRVRQLPVPVAID